MSYKSYRKDIRESLDPHLAVDPEDRTYLTSDLTEEGHDFTKDLKQSRRRGRRRSVERGEALDRDYKPRKKGDVRLPRGTTDVVCIDGSDGADRALLYAARNLPKDHTLLLVHGVHSWTGGITDTDKPDILEIEDHYASLCQKAGRDCRFKHFSYTSTSGFGDEVCRIADKKGAASVVTGRRENISGMRRTLMGSSSQSVMNNCYVPVTIVGTAINTKTKQ